MPEYGKLIILKKGDVAGPEFPLRRRVTVFGNSADVDICIKRDDVEAMHARIDIQPLSSNIHLTNLSSQNGAVMVNKTELGVEEKHLLADKDIINIRGRKFRLEINPEPFENKENVSENIVNVESGKTEVAVVSKEKGGVEKPIIKETKKEASESAPVEKKTAKAKASKKKEKVEEEKEEEKEEEEEEEEEEVEEPPKPAKAKKAKAEPKPKAKSSKSKSKKVEEVAEEVAEEEAEEEEPEEKPKKSKKKGSKKQKQEEAIEEEEEETVVEPKAKKSKSKKSTKSKKAKKVEEVQEEEEEAVEEAEAEEGEEGEEEAEDEVEEETADGEVKKKRKRRSKSQRITDDAVPKPPPRTPIKRKERTTEEDMKGLVLKRHKRETQDLEAFTAKLQDRASRREAATPVKAPAEEKKTEKKEKSAKEKEKAKKLKAAKEKAAKEEKAKKAKKAKADKAKAAKKAKSEEVEVEEEGDEEAEENEEAEEAEEEAPKKKAKKETKKKETKKAKVVKKETKPTPAPTTPTKKTVTPKDIQESGIEVVALNKDSFLPQTENEAVARLLKKDDKHKGKRELKMLAFQSASQARFMTPDSVRDKIVQANSPAKRTRNPPARNESEGFAVSPVKAVKKGAKKEKAGAKKEKKVEEEDVDVETVEDAPAAEEAEKETEEPVKSKKAKGKAKGKKGQKKQKEAPVSDAEKSPVANKTKSAESPKVSSVNSSMEVTGNDDAMDSEWTAINPSPAKSDSAESSASGEEDVEAVCRSPREYVYAILTETGKATIEDIAKKAFEEMEVRSFADSYELASDIKTALVQDSHHFQCNTDGADELWSLVI